MTVIDYLNEIFNLIKEKNKEIEAVKMLICDVLEIDNITMHYHDNLTINHLEKLNRLLSEYVNDNKPVQYILGYTYFYGEKFFVTKDTLIPRFDTEVVVEEAINQIESYLKERKLKQLNIVDIGTGSGIIAIILKKHFGDKVLVDAIDISPEALEVAKANSKYHNVEINFIHNDLLKGIDKKYDFIISNPPYIEKSEEELSKMGFDVLEHEPHLALFANDKGMEFYIQIIKQSFNNLKEFGIIIFEIGYNQKCLMEELVQRMYPNSKFFCKKDYGDNPRCFIIMTEV